MRKRFLLIICSFCLLYDIQGQNLENTFALATRLYSNNHFGSAIKYYQRVAFFGNDSVKALVYPKIAESCLRQGNYTESLFYYNLSLNTTSSDSLYYEYLFSRVLCHILLGNLDYALHDIYGFHDTGSFYFTRKYFFYMGIISLKREDPTGSLSHFLNASNSEIEKEMIELAFSGTDPGKPKPGTAKIFSIFLPGLGQLYAGDYLSAANSFVLNAGLVGLLLSIASRQSFMDAAVSIGPWLQRYYTGGYHNAEKTAIIKQQQKRQELLGRVYEIFESE